MDVVLDQPGTTFVDIAASPTGPGPGDTDSVFQGSEASKRNALTHELTATKVFSPALKAAIDQCAANLTEAYQPATAYEHSLVANMGRASVQLSRCRQLLAGDSERRATRAQRCWDGDRRAAIEKLAARLPKEPHQIKPALERSKQGVDWLLTEWAVLLQLVLTNNCLNVQQRQRAFDMLGVRTEDREGHAFVPAETDAVGLRSLAEGELSRLRKVLSEKLIGEDRSDQLDAIKGFPVEEDAVTKRLRRYETRLSKEWNHYRNELLWLRGVIDRPGATRPDQPGPHGRRGRVAGLVRGDLRYRNHAHSGPGAGGRRGARSSSRAEAGAR